MIKKSRILRGKVYRGITGRDKGLIRGNMAMRDRTERAKYMRKRQTG